MAFQEGDAVEVMSNEDGFYNSYWEGTVVMKLDSVNKYIVEYKNLVEEDNSSLPLREVVPGHEIRPVPPESQVVRYKYGDRVDAFDNDGWWAGTIVGLGQDYGTYQVYFENFNVGLEYDVTKIRVHQDWIKGRWSVPSQQKMLQQE